MRPKKRRDAARLDFFVLALPPSPFRAWTATPTLLPPPPAPRRERDLPPPAAWFETFIFLVILASTIVMASQDMSDRGSKDAGIAAFEVACTALFAAEAAIKIIDQGFWFASRTYMRSGWNKFDLALVVGALAALVWESVGSQFLALRAFRCFRPLRAMK